MRQLVLRASASIAIATLIVSTAVSGQSGVRKSIFLCFTDQAGKPVKNVSGEIFIREDGADRQIVEVKGASQPRAPFASSGWTASHASTNPPISHGQTVPWWYAASRDRRSPK